MSTVRRETMKKEIKVVMFPNNNGSYKSGIYIDSNKKLHTHNVTNGGRMQHLYFISDEKTKDGDYYLDEYDGKFIILIASPEDRYEKIIASTNESLSLPRPSAKFLQEYCEFGGTDRVMVEYDQFDDQCDSLSCGICNCSNNTVSLIDELKVAPDNTINIDLIK